VSRETTKRVFDVVMGAVAVVITMPLMVMTAVTVLVTSGRPVFLVQERVGGNERPIRVVKFRTMHRGAPVVAKSELRVTAGLYTPLGPFLRKTSLDELPQLWNVLRGEMSLVGPRPALPSQADLLALRRATGVTALKPGLTGLAQVLGRESLTLSTKVRAEALYARRVSLRLDVGILLWTIRAVLFGRGAY